MDATMFELARLHHGVLTRTDLLGAGLSPAWIERRVLAGWLTPIFPGVYQVPATRMDRTQRITAATLTAPDAAADAHDAAYLLGLHPLLTEPYRTKAGHLHVAIPHIDRLRRDGVRVRRQLHRIDDDVMQVDGTSVVAPQRLVIDMAGRWTLSRTGRLFDELLRRRLVTVEAVAVRHEQLARRGRRGVRVVDALLAQRVYPTFRFSNRFEERISELLVANGFPAPVRQHRVALPDGRVRFIDLAYPEALIGFEGDEYEYHSTRTDWAADQVRSNELVALGWRLFRVTDETIERPGAFLRDVDALYRSVA